MADQGRGVTETTRIFTHGDGQTVDLPEGFRFDEAEVAIRREGRRVILEPIRKPAKTKAELDAMWAEIDALADPDDPFPDPLPQTVTPPPTW